MIQSRGYATWTDPDRPLLERDTLACGHCGRAIFVKPGTAATMYLRWSVSRHAWVEEMGCGCRLCMSAVCLVCHADGRCLPLEQRIAQMERGV